MKTPSPTVLLWLLAAPPALAASGTVDRTFQESFDVRPGDRLVLRHEDGDVRVTPWDRDTLEIHVTYLADYSEGGLGMSEKRDFTVDFQRDDGRIRVTGRELGGGGIRLGWSSMKVHEHLYAVRAPAWLELELRGDDGDVEVAGWTGATAIRLEDGDVSVAGFTGTLEVVLDDGDLSVRESSLTASRFELEDGDVDLQSVSGELDVTLDDGDVTGRALKPHRFFVRSADGDVDLGVLPTDVLDLEVRTDDGDARLRLAGGVSARFDVETDDGGVRIDLPSALEVEERRHLARGRLGDGAGRIRVQTQDGAVALREVD